MMLIVPFEPEHLEGLQLQSAQAQARDSFTGIEYGKSLKNGGPSFSGILDGKVICASGVVNVWEGRSIAWALFSQDAIDNFAPIYRGIKKFLDLHDAHRVEAYVDCGFDKAHRMMQKLGFKIECERMRAFTPDGRDCTLYALIRE